MEGEAMDTVFAYGSGSFRSSLRRRDLRSPSATFRREQASGTRSSTGFSFITQNWRGKSLLTQAIIVNLIANTTTSTGLDVHAYLDEGEYPLKTQVTDEQMKLIKLTRAKFHGEWNDTIRPSQR